ncbi:MAG TPA: hypothetical protein VIM65_23230 [Cyclobacteriaceae bacterium]
MKHQHLFPVKEPIDNVKINATGQAEIIDLYGWMDGGTVTVRLATTDHSVVEIEFTQKANLQVTERNPNPGRLLLNKKVVDIRSDLEIEIITLLKNAIYSDDPSHDNKHFRESLNEAINFVSTDAYILLARQLKTENK